MRSEFNPQVMIEAKLTEDDGTARDKATCVQHLAELGSLAASEEGRFEVIACIGGFGVRRENMRRENALLVFPTDACCDNEHGGA